MLSRLTSPSPAACADRAIFISAFPIVTRSIRLRTPAHGPDGERPSATATRDDPIPAPSTSPVRSPSRSTALGAIFRSASTTRPSISAAETRATDPALSFSPCTARPARHSSASASIPSSPRSNSSGCRDRQTACRRAGRRKPGECGFPSRPHHDPPACPAPGPKGRDRRSRDAGLHAPGSCERSGRCRSGSTGSCRDGPG